MKDLKISKELIKAVLQKETEILSKDFNFTINEDYIEFSDDGEMQFEYCIYKFSFKCKEWAWDKGYGFESLPFAEKLFERFNSYDVVSFGYSNEDRKDKIPYKIKYIIKVCEYILSEVSK